MSPAYRSPTRYFNQQPIPFTTTEEAWLWFILAQEAKTDGARIVAGLSMSPRPCEPADILTCVERLYRNRRLTMDHLLVLRHYGKRQLPPDVARVKEARAHALWREALDRLEPVLVKKGIVAERDFLAVPARNRNWAAKPAVFQGGMSL